MTFPELFPDQIKVYDFSIIHGNFMTCGNPVLDFVMFSGESKGNIGKKWVNIFSGKNMLKQPPKLLSNNQSPESFKLK